MLRGWPDMLEFSIAIKNSPRNAGSLILLP